MDYEITDVVKGTLVSDQSRFLDVTALFGKKIERKFAFQLDTSDKAIHKEMKAIAKVLNEEIVSAKANAKANAIEAKADKTIKTLTGK